MSCLMILLIKFFRNCELSKHSRQRSSICEGREFIDCPARYKCPFANTLFKLWTNVENWMSSPNHCWCLHIADLTLSCPAFANTFVSGCFCLIIYVNLSVFHYEMNFHYSINIFVKVTINGNNICEKSRFYYSYFITPV